MSYNKLYFNMVEIDSKTSSITLKPNFLCPKCGDQKHPETRPTAMLATPKYAISPTKDLNLQGEAIFKMPCCGTTITLYVALHKTAGKDDLATCIATEPIPSEWWKA